MHCEQNEAFSVRLVNGMNWEVKETRQGHRQTEWRGMEGGRGAAFRLLLSVIPKYEVPCYHSLVLIFSLTVFFIIGIMQVITSSLLGIL